MNPWCRPAAQEKQDRPTLVLLLGCGRGDEIALAVGAGCEEEGVPVIWERADGGADELARQAARRSRLEVGIGIGSDAGAVTFAKYPSPRAYLKADADDLKSARWLGQAAACFVKSKPLPEKLEKVPQDIGVSREEQKEGEKQILQTVEALVNSEPAGVADEGTSEAVVARITRAVMESMRRQH